jgi:hypothetical protein
MIGHVCRVCVETLTIGSATPDFCTVVADVANLHGECILIEADLHDCFNAFCFTCRRITMSVPGGVTASEQVCYLRAQVNWFQQMEACGLFVRTRNIACSDSNASGVGPLVDRVFVDPAVPVAVATEVVQDTMTSSGTVFVSVSLVVR